MSSDSLAVFRKGLGPDLDALAEKHMQHEYVSFTTTPLQPLQTLTLPLLPA